MENVELESLFADLDSERLPITDELLLTLASIADQSSPRSPNCRSCDIVMPPHAILVLIGRVATKHRGAGGLARVG
jgi:hypothetical protein